MIITRENQSIVVDFLTESPVLACVQGAARS